MATYFDPTADAEILSPDLASSPDLQRLIDKAESMILYHYEDALDVEKTGFGQAMKYAIEEQALELWREKDPAVKSVSKAGQNVSYQYHSFVCTNAKMWLKPFILPFSATGIPHLDR